jgi:hypothetical protein
VVRRRAEHGDGEQDPGEHHQPQRDAVDAQRPRDVGILDPLHVVEELEAGFVGVERDRHRDGEGPGHHGEQDGDLLGDLGATPGDQRGEDRAEDRRQDDGRQEGERGRVRRAFGSQDGGEH